jgi:hypothetical protein
VLLLTDGLANQGVNEPEALVAMARGARDEGVGTTSMADAGAGNASSAVRASRGDQGVRRRDVRGEI